MEKQQKSKKEVLWWITGYAEAGLDKTGLCG